MKKIKLNFKIDWKSKIIELLIVIIGISIAFKLNNWNESEKAREIVKNYIANFSEENKSNGTNLEEAIEFSISNKCNIDTLKQLLLSKNYSDERIARLSSSMMTLVNFSPSVTTMENIKASGEFELIKDVVLRKRLINTYNSFNRALDLEGLLTNYINEYVTQFFFNNIRLSDFNPINSKFVEDPKFENIVIGYEVLLNQQINGYQESLEKVKRLNEHLITTADRE